MSGAFYNEWEAYPAAWLRNLIAAGRVAPGVVDERSIRDLRPDDVAGPGQRHLFAGLGGWSCALRLAGVRDDADVWTLSCPCQPFSVAGRGAGVDDERHLWPVALELIAECRPPILFGEQVAGKAGLAWFAAVRADLERIGYAVGAADLAAASVGAPHIRQRLFFGAVRLSDADGAGLAGRAIDGGDGVDGESSAQRGLRGGVRGLPDAACIGRGEGGMSRDVADDRARPADGGGMGDADGEPSGRDGRAVPGAQGEDAVMRRGDHGPRAASDDVGGAAGPWDELEWIACRDGKARPTQPGIHPLAHGVPGRVGMLRAAGNAIVPEVAAEFVGAFLDALTDARAA